MTLNNTLRLNERRLHPTPHIIFIKPLKDRPDSAVAEEFLNRVAAICHPLLKSHHLRVTTLEEFPPNREFCGRNFNAGECIQLVLRRQSRSSSRAVSGSGSGSTDDDDGFLPFRAVVMVMMHELAHNAQMNHSPAFWAVRNEYAAEMRQLWARGYTGEGMWGPGRQAASGIRVGGGRELDGAEMPEHLCGGTYRSRRGRGGRRAASKRKVKAKVDWREQKERRIRKKFGVSGKALGEDTVERMALQGFKGPTNKSRVAGSKRGRELRAAAALARFEKGAVESQGEKDGVVGEGEGDSEEEEETTDQEDDEDEYESGQDAGVQDAKDVDGTRMKDEHGLGLIRVCEDDEADDVHVKEEMDELNRLRDVPWHEAGDGGEAAAKKEQEAESSAQTPMPSEAQAPARRVQATTTASELDQRSDPDGPSPTPARDCEPLPTATATTTATATGSSSPATITCKICSMDNDRLALLCAACSNVLDPRKSPGAWRCAGETCRGSEYLNPADYGVCGVCGASKAVIPD